MKPHLSCSQSHLKARRGGFTLVEILVAIGIMALLLSVIMVPLRLSFDMFHIGKARSEVQQEAQLSVQQMASDLKKAQFIFPNTYVPGVSDNTELASNCSPAPYKSDLSNTSSDWKYLPYIEATSSTADPATTISTVGITSSAAVIKAYSNPSRLDMIQFRGSPTTGTKSSDGEDVIVSYYPRRLDISKPYDIIDNPIVLFRAQYLYRYYDGAPSTTTKQYLGFALPATSPTFPGVIDTSIDWTAYPATVGGAAANADKNRSFLWITHNFYGEANLEPLCTDDKSTSTVPAFGLHNLASPRGMGLVAPKANSSAANAYVPELSFVQEATSGKKIDRVTINMTLAQYDLAGAAAANGNADSAAQRVRVSQIVDLPNANTGCSP